MSRYLSARFVDLSSDRTRRQGARRRHRLDLPSRRRRPRPGSEHELEGVRPFARAAKALRDIAPGWGPKVDLGPHLRVRSRRGYRPAVVEVKPGLYLVAELPDRAVEMGFAPAVMLAPAIARTLARAVRGRQERRQLADGGGQVRQLPGPVDPDWQDDPRRGRPRPSERVPRWLDEEDAEELGLDFGCGACRSRR